MNDNITVSRELLRKIFESIDSRCGTNAPERTEVIPALIELLDAPAVEPVAEVVWSKDTDYEYRFKMLVELSCKEGEPVKLYAGPFESGGLYWHDTETDKPAAPQAVKLTHPQIIECHPVLYGLDDDTLAFAKAIEQAVWEKLGVSDD